MNALIDRMRQQQNEMLVITGINDDLTYAEITDRGITTLSKFENLERLYLEGNKKVTVQGINQLKNLKNLNYLNLVLLD